MFRISQFTAEIDTPTLLETVESAPAPVVIWNLTRRCNLSCRHCYSISANTEFPGELSFAECSRVLEQLRAFRVPVVIFSGGEPLLRPDVFDLARLARELGLRTALSSNGTLIDASNIEAIADSEFSYVGISIDGIGSTHDRFRRRKGAFAASIQGLRLCQQHGIRTGLRFTMTQDNAHELPAILRLMADEGVERFYFSHLNYAGRGNTNRQRDALHQMTRDAMDLLFETSLSLQRDGRPKTFTSGNNDADGVYFLHWVRRHFPQSQAHVEAHLRRWGGNASGLNVANIDNLGNVHPDTMWWHLCLGNVKSRSFGEIWNDLSDPVMERLKRRPRALGGRCGACRYLRICNGNTRVRALQTSGDVWGEDPGCYLSDAEVGLASRNDLQ